MHRKPRRIPDGLESALLLVLDSVDSAGCWVRGMLHAADAPFPGQISVSRCFKGLVMVATFTPPPLLYYRTAFGVL